MTPTPGAPEAVSPRILADIGELAGYAEGSKSPRMRRASRAAFAWLDRVTSAQTDAPSDAASAQLRARIAELEHRLEISPDHPYDGIDTRDRTIAALESALAGCRTGNTMHRSKSS